MEINTLDILKNLARILVAAKLLGIVARKLGAPQVVGEIIAGLIVGPCMLNFVSYDGFISGMAEIGVILLMFSAGLGTDLKELIKTGPVALLVAFAGVIVSVAGGAAVYLVFGFGDGDLAMLEAVFMGTILAATSHRTSHRCNRFQKPRCSACVRLHQHCTFLCSCIYTRLCTLFSLQVARQALAALKKNSDFRPCSLLCVCILCGRIFRNCRHHRRICCRYYSL